MESARINPKNPQGDHIYLGLPTTYELTVSNKIASFFLLYLLKRDLYMGKNYI